LIEQPATTDQLGDGGAAAAQRCQFGENGVLKGGEILEQLVADGVFDEVAEFFDGSEFGAVGRQGHEAHIGRHPGIVGPQVETGLVLDDHVERRRIALAELREEQGVDVLIDGGREQQFHPVSPSTSMASCR